MAVPLTARHPVPFTPPSLLQRNIALAKDGKPAIDVMIRVPTMYERDSFSAALVRGGVIHYSRQQIRDLYKAGATHLYDDDKFDQVCADLEELWQVVDATKLAELARTEKYIELMERQANLPPDRHMTEQQLEAELQAIQPDVVIPEKKRVKTTAIQQDITARYEPLQKALADLAEQDIRRNWLSVEIYVVNWHGLEHTAEGNGRGGITRVEAEYLRSQIGEKAFDEIGGFVLALHSIDGDEEKNLASLIESSSAPIGSTLAESMAQNEAGTSTDEPSIETPDTESAETTASSLSSTKPSRKRTARSDHSRTAKPSSTSPSS